ncbi:MAG: TIGR04282 family arsenosugar biosynthesis glycosyltransferase [Vicinamibacterales bacterium]
MPVMEEVDLIRRLRRVGRLHRSSLPLETLARRWGRDGWFRRIGRNWLLATLHAAGVNPRHLARRCEGRRRSVVAVLARRPSSGGKKRLFQSLGIARDAALTRALLADTVMAIERVRHVDRALILTPPENCGEITTHAAWTWLAQRGGDLGERMAAAFQDLHRLGYENVVLIGSDLPTLPPAFIARAVHALRTRRATVVLGPSADGGYYLIGLRRPADALFQGVSWGTSAVLEQTRRRAQALGLSVHLLDAWYDVDDAPSLRRAVRESRASQTATWWRSRMKEGA